MSREVNLEPSIVFKPSDRIWVGVCDSFAHAFSEWLHLPDRELWFIGPADEYRLITSGKGGWVHLHEPEPRRGNSNHAPYRGPLSAKDLRTREKNRKREQRRRDRLRRERN